MRLRRDHLLNTSAIAIAWALAMPPLHAEAQQPARVTILYDAFGPTSALRKDWGFAALVEYGGRRVLFDTGNDAGIFAARTGTFRACSRACGSHDLAPT